MKTNIKKDRWEELLAWADAQVCSDPTKKGTEPYGRNDIAGGDHYYSSDSIYREPTCYDDWVNASRRLEEFKPRTDTELQEADLLLRLISSDRAETIESTLAGVPLEQAFHLTKGQIIEAKEYAAFEALPSNEKASMAKVPSLQVCLYARTYAIMQGDAERNTHATRGRKQLKHLHDINRGGTPRYTDEEIIAAFKSYKKRCGKMSLSSAIANIIDPARGGAEHLDYANATALWKKRLPAIAAPARPSQWWKDL